MIGDLVLPAVLQSVLKLDTTGRPAGIKAYVDRVLKEAGDPKDPLERMLIEESLLAHHLALQLVARAADCDTAQLAATYGGAAARLFAEVRRTSLAIREYRKVDEPRKTTVIYKVDRVDQQVIGHGDQDVGYLRSSAGGEESVRARCSGELSDTGGDGNVDNFGFCQNEGEEPAPRRRRAAQLPEARTVDA